MSARAPASRGEVPTSPSGRRSAGFCSGHCEIAAAQWRGRERFLSRRMVAAVALKPSGAELPGISGPSEDAAYRAARHRIGRPANIRKQTRTVPVSVRSSLSRAMACGARGTIAACEPSSAPDQSAASARPGQRRSTTPCGVRASGAWLGAAGGWLFLSCGWRPPSPRLSGTARSGPGPAAGDASSAFWLGPRAGVGSVAAFCVAIAKRQSWPRMLRPECAS